MNVLYAVTGWKCNLGDMKLSIKSIKTGPKLIQFKFIRLSYLEWLSILHNTKWIEPQPYILQCTLTSCESQSERSQNSQRKLQCTACAVCIYHDPMTLFTTYLILYCIVYNVYVVYTSRQTYYNHTNSDVYCALKSYE